VGLDINHQQDNKYTPIKAVEKIEEPETYPSPTNPSPVTRSDVAARATASKITKSA
jgi:hypothetical protein